MSFCPIDGKPCCDDLCHGGACIASDFELDIEERCTRCGGLCPRDAVIYGICIDCRSEFEDDDEGCDAL